MLFSFVLIRVAVVTTASRVGVMVGIGKCSLPLNADADG